MYQTWITISGMNAPRGLLAHGRRAVADDMNARDFLGRREAADEKNPLYCRDPRGDGEHDQDSGKHSSAERETEQRLRRGEQHEPLGPLQEPDFRIEAKGFRAGACV